MLAYLVLGICVIGGVGYLAYYLVSERNEK